MVSKSSKSGSGGPTPAPAVSGPAAERAEQLAQALRDNLRRRKSQARARQDGPARGEAGAKKPEDPPKV